MMLRDIPIGKYLLWSGLPGGDIYLVATGGLYAVRRLGEYIPYPENRNPAASRLSIDNEASHWVVPEAARYVEPCTCPVHVRLGFPTFHDDIGVPVYDTVT